MRSVSGEAMCREFRTSSAENGPRPEADIEDFALKAQVRDLFAHLDALGNGTIRRLEVQHGLPFRMQVEEVPA